MNASPTLLKNSLVIGMEKCGTLMKPARKSDVILTISTFQQAKESSMQNLVTYMYSPQKNYSI